MNINNKEPKPKKNKEKCIQDLVIEDMKKRKEIGKKKYGTVLQPFNGRNSLVDAYQEVGDLCVYLRQTIEEDKRIRFALRTSYSYLLSLSPKLPFLDELYKLLLDIGEK